MGTMLITRSTLRITYRIGIRAGLCAAEDKLLPGLDSEASGAEVAADVTVIYESLIWKERAEPITKVPTEMTVRCGFRDFAVGRPYLVKASEFRFCWYGSSAHG